jgi:uncharacterized protein
MADGKPAGVRCIQLDSNDGCKLFGKPDRPSVCVRLKAERGMCGSDRAEAMKLLTALEAATS